MTTVRIPLTRGMAATVDAADAPLVLRMKWHAIRSYNKWYARTCVKFRGTRTVIYMHRLLLQEPESQVDHANGDGLDNRRLNIRPCATWQNQHNSGPHAGKQFRGVRRNGNRWRAGITVRGKRIALGSFASDIEAAKAYDVAAVAYCGEFAFINFKVGGASPTKQCEERA